MFVPEFTAEDKDLFAAKVPVSLKALTRRKLHQGDRLCTVLMQGHHLQITLTRQPGRAVGIHLYMSTIVGLKLVQLHQDLATFLAERRMAEACRITEVRTGAIVARLI